MRKVLQGGFFLALLLGILPGAQAQRRLFRTMPAPPAPAQRMFSHVVLLSSERHGAGAVLVRQAGSMTSTSLPNTSGDAIVTSGAAPLTVQELLNPVPGLGFDFTHLAAVNQNLGLRALIDPVTQLELAQAERLLREIPVAFPGFAFFEPSTPVVLVQQQPPVVIVQQPSAAAPAPVEEAASAQAAPPAPMAQAPLPDIGEFTLVLRDGTQVEAVAFTRQDGQIVYITRDGSRHSFPVLDLDATATTRVNQEHGTSLQLPN